MTQNEAIFRYDSRTQTLTKTQEIDLEHEDEIVGKQKRIEEYKKSGAVKYWQEIQKQLNTFQQQSKILKKRLDTEFQETQIDKDFLKKYEAVTQMKKKQELEQALQNTEEAIKSVKKEIRNLEGAGCPKK